MAALMEMDPVRAQDPGETVDARPLTAPERALRFKDVDLPTARNLIENQQNLQILDVRTPVEHADCRIRHSFNIDFYADDFEQQLATLDRQAEYLIYCRSGGRSAFTLEMLEGLGFTDVAHMPAGIEGWIEAGLPTASD